MFPKEQFFFGKIKTEIVWTMQLNAKLFTNYTADILKQQVTRIRHAC